MPTVLAISPHLDDAVFSAGGALSRYARDGWRVVVATVFTASMPHPTGFALACQLDKGLPADIDYMALRRNEDAAACAIIGAHPVWLAHPEAPHRGYHSAPALFAGLHSEDGIVDHITPALARLIETETPHIVLAPQAVGAHCDHIAVYLALARCRLTFQFWIDFPYSIRPTPRPSPFADELDAHARLIVNLDDRELRTKREAVACYASQLGFQFGGADKAEAAASTAGSIERFACKPARSRGSVHV